MGGGAGAPSVGVFGGGMAEASIETPDGVIRPVSPAQVQHADVAVVASMAFEQTQAMPVRCRGALMQRIVDEGTVGTLRKGWGRRLVRYARMRSSLGVARRKSKQLLRSGSQRVSARAESSMSDWCADGRAEGV